MRRWFGEEGEWRGRRRKASEADREGEQVIYLVNGEADTKWAGPSNYYPLGASRVVAARYIFGPTSAP
jgi:hypothetical protein